MGEGTGLCRGKADAEVYVRKSMACSRKGMKTGQASTQWASAVFEVKTEK